MGMHAHRAGRPRRYVRDQEIGGRKSCGGASPGRRWEISETHSDIGGDGVATMGGSAAIADTHSMAQHGPAEPMPSCWCLAGSGIA